VTKNGNVISNHLVFSQRYRYEPLPAPMQLEQLSDDLRRRIWSVLYDWLVGARSPAMYGYFFSGTEDRFIQRVLSEHRRKPEDEIDTDYEQVLRDFKSTVLQGRFNIVLDLLEIIINERNFGVRFAGEVKDVFELCGAPYWLDISHKPHHFHPRTSQDQGQATQQAVQTLHENHMDGATTHLRQAVEHVNAGQYADSISDSIHAVASVARKIDPKANRKLSSALDSLERAGVLKHRALKRALSQLYGYASNEQGIRHELVDQSAADVGLDEAMFMYGACASFAAYLASKHRALDQSRQDSE